MTIFWGKRGKICMKKNRINKRMEKNFTNKDQTKMEKGRKKMKGRKENIKKIVQIRFQYLGINGNIK